MYSYSAPRAVREPFASMLRPQYDLTPAALQEKKRSAAVGQRNQTTTRPTATRGISRL